MPTYRFKCPDGHTQDEFRSMARMDEPATCQACGVPAARTFIPWDGGFNQWSLGTFGVHGGYFDRGLGRHVSSVGHRNQIMREQGVREGGTIADTERAIAAEVSRGEAIERAWKADMAELNRDPDLLRARDQGRINFPTVEQP